MGGEPMWRLHARLPGVFRAAAIAAVLLGACNKPTSDNIQLWKTTEKGPDRLKDALGDHGVAPKLRAEAAVALVDIGQADEVDTIIGKMPVEDRAELTKSL